MQWSPRHVGIALAGAAIACAAQAQSVPATYLYQRLQPLSAARTLSLDLHPGAWRVGSSDGPAASEAMLHALLQTLQGIVVAGRCAAPPVETVQHSCAFAMAEPAFAGMAVARLGDGVLGWVATGGPAPQRHLGLLAPQRHLADRVGAAKLLLQFTELPGELSALLDGAGASLILHNDARGDAAAVTAVRESAPVAYQRGVCGLHSGCTPARGAGPAPLMVDRRPGRL